MTVGLESLPNLSGAQRELYEQAVAASGVDPAGVLVVCLTEAGIEVDVVDYDDVRLPVRTQRVAVEELRRGSTTGLCRAPKPPSDRLAGC